MKINKATRCITLGRSDTKRWEDSGPDGYEFRAMVRDVAKRLATPRKSIGIFASKSAGGWCADEVTVEVQ